MTAAYWEQYSYSEIISMHGVECDEDFEEDDDLDSDEEKYSGVCNCMRCNDCLGVDW